MSTKSRNHMESRAGQPRKHPPSQLCRKCQTIHFERYLRERIGFGPVQTWRSISLGSWRRIQSKGYCPFCRLVVACIRKLQDPKLQDWSIVKLTNKKSWILSSSHERYDGSRSKHYSNKLDLERAATVTHSEHAYRFLVYWEGCEQPGEIQYLAHRDPPDRRQFFGRPVNPEAVDWDVINYWLHACKKYHSGSCDKPGLASSRLPGTLRVIDVTRGCVVQAPKEKDFEYVALTYVWGERKVGWPIPKTTRDQIRINTAGEEIVDLPPRLPQTIEDAIEVVRRLGYRYLWTDSLCIVQDDWIDRHDQINRMDAVYNCAALTIAAGSGEHADCGIPGISVSRRHTQYSEVAKGLRLAVCLPKYDELNEGDRLPWNTRGWAFQEKLLSRRLLLFTDYQVYFRCSNAIWSEDIQMEYRYLSSSVGRRPDPFRWAPERLQNRLSKWEILLDITTLGKLKLLDDDKQLGYLPNYVAIITDFTRRSFSVPSDVLPAIDGIIQTMDPSGKYPFHAGMPSKYMMKALLWQPTTGKPNSLFNSLKVTAPTWSWAAWTLPAGCLWHPDDIQDLTEPLPGTRVVLSSNDSWDTIPGRRITASHLQLQLPICSLLVHKAVVHLFSIGRKAASPNSASLHHSAVARNERRVASPIGDIVDDYELLDSHGRCVGEVRTTARVAQKGYGEMYKVWGMSKGNSLLVAKPHDDFKPYRIDTHYEHKRTGLTKYSLGEEDKSDYNRVEKKNFRPREEWKVVNVMLISWDRSCASRIAIGRVMKMAWADQVEKRSDFRLI